MADNTQNGSPLLSLSPAEAQQELADMIADAEHTLEAWRMQDLSYAQSNNDEIRRFREQSVRPRITQSERRLALLRALVFPSSSVVDPARDSAREFVLFARDILDALQAIRGALAALTEQGAQNMATQKEQLQALNDKIEEVAAAVTAVDDQLAAEIEVLKSHQENPDNVIDLGPSIDRLDALRASLPKIATDADTGATAGTGTTETGATPATPETAGTIPDGGSTAPAVGSSSASA